MSTRPSPKPSLQDRLLRRAVPRPDATAPASPPDELADGLFALDRRLVHFGLARLPTRTTILRLGDGRLVVVSPPPGVGPETVAAIDALGRVADVVVPNSFHHLFATDFVSHYPDARLLVAPELGRRVPELGSAMELGPELPSGWAGELELAVLGPVRGVSEVLLFHRPSEALILTDVAFNMTSYARPLDRFIWRASGIPGRFAPGRTSRSLLLCDAAVASQCLSRVLEWPIRRIVVAHGEAIEHDAPARFRAAFAHYL